MSGTEVSGRLRDALDQPEAWLTKRDLASYLRCSTRAAWRTSWCGWLASPARASGAGDKGRGRRGLFGSRRPAFGALLGCPDSGGQALALDPPPMTFGKEEEIAYEPEEGS
jgi:hypothetical protein